MAVCFRVLMEPKERFQLLACLMMMLVSATVQIHRSPIAAWGFNPATKTTVYNTSTLFMSVGSDVMFFDDHFPPGASFRLSFSESVTSRLSLIKLSDLKIENEFGIVFYINYDLLDDGQNDYSGTKIVFDSGFRLACQNGQYNGQSQVPAFQIESNFKNGYSVQFGDYRSCTRNSVGDSTSFYGWARHAVSIHRSNGRCSTRVLKAGTERFHGVEHIDCDEYLNDDITPCIGDSLLSPTDNGDNFVGSLACIQLYDLAFSSVTEILDLCQGDNVPQTAFFYWGQYFPQTILETTPTTTVVTREPATTSTATTTITIGPTTTSSTTTTTTTTAARTETQCSECCYCSCSIAQNSNISSSEVQEIVDEIQKTLIIDKQTTSSLKRKKTSAEDHRQSAHVLATFGIGLCTFAAALVIGLDLMDFSRKLTNCRTCC